ncbi:protein ROLLING AND ERECT LEAF 2-like [Malania oleifera]|uniref:protein ROLLING AND ERECT LEAF 2-like n=1 Tax=Malania oleifera TaxID=397392 RepID=UPI0025ADD3FD|nr:protein ROLLING AND ERECT LEAF 2-like [Malania oleifera]
MGCTQSKIENEEAVSRCKDRRQYMKGAVSARNAFAAAHSAYGMALKNTGAALSDYAPGESHHHHHQLPAAAPQPPMDTLIPPPPLPHFGTPASPAPHIPISRAVSMPEIAITKPDHFASSETIVEGDEDEADHEGSSSSLRRRSRGRSGSKINKPPEVAEDEDGPPPLPPQPDPELQPQRDHNPPEASMMEDSWDYFFNDDNMLRPSLAEVDEDKTDREAIDRKMFEERSKRSEAQGPEKSEVQAVEKEVEPSPLAPTPPSPTATVTMGAKTVKKGKLVSSLVKIFSNLDDHFLKASESAHEVSKMLEANRLHYHSNFADNRGHIDHSARVMRVITWNRSFRGLQNQDDANDDFDSEEHETHATVLDKLLAWEKKLYDEVKAGELMKFEYQRKVALLNKQKKRGTNSEALEKTKATVSHLHTRYIVDMQSMDSTVTEINRLRDNQLYPRLVALVDGMAAMWRTMHSHHDHQSKIAMALRSLDTSQAPKETSEHHHERTIQLWAVVQEWHSQFEKLMTHQKEYVRALNSWLRLNLIPIESSLREKVSSPPKPQNPPIQPLLQAWHDHLEKLPDEGAKSAINNFAAVINTIVEHQVEEIKLKLKCEDLEKELNRKKRQFEDWYKKYTQRRTQSDESQPGGEDGIDDEAIVERRVAVEALENRLEEEKEAHKKQCTHVREKSLVSLRTRLPELFRAMSEFAQVCSEMYTNLRSISQSRNPDGSSSRDW